MSMARLIFRKSLQTLISGHKRPVTNKVKSSSFFITRGVSTQEPTGFGQKLQEPDIGSINAAQPLIKPSRIQRTLKGNVTKSKKQISDRIEAVSAQGFFNVTAFATAEEYNLEALHTALTRQDLYIAKKFFSTDHMRVDRDVLYVTAKYPVDVETRDIFFFREGTVVLWNFNEMETNNILSFIRPFEKDPYLTPLVKGESEVMPYTYIPQHQVDVEGDLVAEKDCNPARAFFKNGKFFLTYDSDNFLQKYTFSDAITTSIKLGIWEATLSQYVDSMFYMTEDLKKGRRIRITRADVLRKTGELFALRHEVNLASDCLDTPDFYWDREELEALYVQICNYFSIGRRTKVMNEKINHCVELAELISHNLNDAHHIRLEWMIIILIMVEVVFEILHFMEREGEAITKEVHKPIKKKFTFEEIN